MARVSFLDEQLERMRVTFDRDSLGGSHFPQLRASANNEQAVFAACRSICRALRQAKDEAMSRSGSAPNAPAPAPAPEQAPHAPAPAPGLASSWGNYASNHAHYSACMQQGCVGAAIASKGISEEERAALQAESAAAQGAAASLDREGRLGGGPLSAAATALDRAAQWPDSTRGSVGRRSSNRGSGHGWPSFRADSSSRSTDWKLHANFE